MPDLPTGAPIHRYGQVIGFASTDIAPGEHVHSHNVEVHQGELDLDYAFSSAVKPVDMVPESERRTFLGYRRADGRNTPGVDVPFPFDSAVTVTVNPGSTAQAGFDIVRVVAKGEAPLVGLVNSQDFISTIADVTFYGKDHAGNDVSAAGSIGITFGNFGDPD